MATHSLRKSSQEGIGYSVAELNDVGHVFAAAVPRCGESLREQADDALRTIEAVIIEGMAFSQFAEKPSKTGVCPETGVLVGSR